MKRCTWVPLDEALYVKYHDEEWDEKRVHVASQDLEQFLRKVYRLCKQAFLDFARTKFMQASTLLIVRSSRTDPSRGLI